MDGVGSVFNYAGAIRMFKFKVLLIRKGVAFTPDFTDLNSTQFANGTQSATKVDELTLQWQQKVSRPRRQGEHDSSRDEQRLFTTLESGKRNTAPVHRKECKEQKMHIMAYLGSLSGDYDEREEYQICTLTLIDESSLSFYPPLSAIGFKLAGKLGEYIAKIHILNEFDMLNQSFSRVDLTPSGEYDLPDENVSLITHLITIDSATKFEKDNLSIIYQFLPLNEGDKPFIGQTESCSQKDGVAHFSHTFEYTYSMVDQLIAPKLLIQVRTEDYWERQHPLSYGSVQLIPRSGSSKMTIPTWTPVDRSDRNAKMREFFLGNTTSADQILLSKSPSLLGVDTESSGDVHISVYTILQSRSFIAKDTLDHIKYGARLGRMGLRSDLYWRIMKVITEFEEARQMLLRVKAVNSTVKQ